MVTLDEIIQALEAIVKGVPVGTNLGLVHFIWMLLQGQLLSYRGAIFPSLQGSGFDEATCRRSWAAFRYGKWKSDELIANWRSYVLEQGVWEVHRYEGYRVLAVDLTGYFRPRLKSWWSKHFHALVGRALPAVIFGVMVSVGRVGSERVPVLRGLVRGHGSTDSEVMKEVLKEVALRQEADEMAVFDAGFSIALLEDADIKTALVRLPQNITFRRNKIPPYCGKGRPQVYGALVRPLPRTYKGTTIEGSPADTTSQIEVAGRTVEVRCWQGLVRSDRKASQDNPTWNIYCLDDPLYDKPLLLACSVSLSPASALAIYQDRWPVEVLPLTSKQILGAHRHFVFNRESCFRLPELTLIVGGMLVYLAATMPAIPTGFWDRNPKPTSGRLRRWLAKLSFWDLPWSDPQLRKKEAVTDHLPKGAAGHRRKKADTSS